MMPDHPDIRHIETTGYPIDKYDDDYWGEDDQDEQFITNLFRHC